VRSGSEESVLEGKVRIVQKGKAVVRIQKILSPRPHC
jgi:hypothetical protein